MFRQINFNLNVLKFLSLFFILLIGFFFCFKAEATNTNSLKIKTIGIIMPMDHNAIRDIVSGFKKSIQAQLGDNIEFKIQNAQNDLNVQRTILQQYLNQNVDLVVPIGTQSTQMTAQIIKDQPIVSLAANIPETLRKNSINLTGVLDEIGPEKPIHYLQKVYPKIKKITLIYSNSEKVFPEVSIANDFANKNGIQLQKLMIQNLPELFTISKLIDKDSEAIFILKDHLIVSGIQTLIKEADNRHIPLMTSDEGSIQSGATFALGIKESTIGEEGGKMAALILQGKKMPNELPIHILDKLFVFYNKKACLQQGIDIEQLEQAAKSQGFSIEETSALEKKP